jgi:hypothetical protein
MAHVSVQAPGLPIAVNIDPSESNLACLAESELRQNLEALGLNVIVSDAELAAAIESSRTGRSAWRFFMICALAFLLLECLLADRMMTRASAKSKKSSTSIPQNA